MNFAEMSRSLRKSRNLTQMELAIALKTSKSCISMIEIGKNEPTANTLLRYADFFQCSTDFLLGREDDFGNIVVNPPDAQLSTEEEHLLKTFKKLDPSNKTRVVAYADIRLEEQKKEVR